MICFPLDNTEYEANALGAWCGTRTRGVYAADNHYAVTANDDMTITVSPGLAWLKAGQYWGVNAFESNPSVLTVDTADGALSRVDAVCVRLDKNQNRGELIIKKGSYTPQPPAIAAPVRNLDYDEIYIATIAVPAGATAISQLNITDQRLNEDYCGIMRDGVTGIPTQQLQLQWQSWLTNFTVEAQQYYGNYQNMLADLYTQYAAGIATREQNADQAFNGYVLRMAEYEQNAQDSFNEWFEAIQSILDENAVTHLQSQIDALPDIFYTKLVMDQLLTEAVSTHNTDSAAHGAINQHIADLETEIADLKLITGPDIAANPFVVTFTSYGDKITTGVRNMTLGRLEF